MYAPMVAALVAASAPDHAQHAQEVLDEGPPVRLMCSCGVGLTIGLIDPPPPVTIKVFPGGEAEAGRTVIKTSQSAEKAKADDGS